MFKTCILQLSSHLFYWCKWLDFSNNYLLCNGIQNNDLEQVKDFILGWTILLSKKKWIVLIKEYFCWSKIPIEAALRKSTKHTVYNETISHFSIKMTIILQTHSWNSSSQPLAWPMHIVKVEVCWISMIKHGLLWAFTCSKCIKTIFLQNFPLWKKQQLKSLMTWGSIMKFSVFAKIFP